MHITYLTQVTGINTIKTMNIIISWFLQLTSTCIKTSSQNKLKILQSILLKNTFSSSKTLCHFIHRVSEKTCQLMFCSVSVKYELILIKIGRHVLEETLNKIIHTVPTWTKICASTTLENLSWQIKLSTQYTYINHENQPTATNHASHK